ncbi:integrase catalytic domain-containing protein [Trichonephila clavipes]|nr:integrase catalytic domain-containing protein [Trichonephila clavipes]
MTLLSPTENSPAVLNHKILEANSQVQNVKLGGHQTCLSINRLWHELCDMLRRLVGTTAPGHHDCSIQERKSKQIMTPLPRDRIGQSPPSAVTGLDFAGPTLSKRFYILLCTCAATRALYLELVTSLTTEAFRRFISRRGLCTVIYSDNAKTFKRAEIEPRRLWTVINHPEAKQFCASNGNTSSKEMHGGADSTKESSVP